MAARVLHADAARRAEGQRNVKLSISSTPSHVLGDIYEMVFFCTAAAADSCNASRLELKKNKPCELILFQ